MTERELIDALATKVMGWAISKKHGECWWEKPDGKTRQRCATGEWEPGGSSSWSPASDMNDAMEVVKKLQDDGTMTTIWVGWDENADPFTRVSMLNEGDDKAHEEGWAETPYAICLAALRAKGIEP